MAKYEKGVLYKKILDNTGKVVGKVPFLVKTLAKLVILKDGTNVQDKIDALDQKKTYLIFDTYADYKEAKSKDEIAPDVLCIIKSYL